MPGRGRAAASSCCGSRISTRAAAGPEFVDGIVEDLRWLGLDWDGEPLVQSQRTAALCRSARPAARARAWSIPASAPAPTSPQSLTAPHGDAGSAYPGTCRGLPDDPERRATDAAQLAARLAPRRSRCAGLPQLDRGRRHALRQPAPATSATPSSPARTRRPATISPASSTMRRAASTWSCAAPTCGPRPRSSGCCRSLLGLPEPTYLHHPLVTHDDGRRLAKRDLAPTLAAMREGGVDGPALAADLLAGQLPLGFACREA